MRVRPAKNRPDGAPGAGPDRGAEDNALAGGVPDEGRSEFRDEGSLS
jgi:hypothetical protein